MKTYLFQELVTAAQLLIGQDDADGRLIQKITWAPS